MEVLTSSVSTTGRVQIVADDREQQSAVCERLARREEVDLQVRRLEVGDYEVQAVWRFERKTIRDFVVSVADGRLFRQAWRLARLAGGRALILEGPDEERAGLSREAWQGALVSLGLGFQLPVLRSRDADETAQLLLYAARQAVRQRETVFMPGRRRARTLERQRVQVLAALPGLGACRARSLLEHFGSIEAVLLAGEDELTEVPGIGSHIAGRIRKVVGAGPHEAWSSEPVE